ncbi:C-type lectin domain family 10 member A-like [Archocentrus centrarchus]|uniref:C-type lectin domain family 10 member A-like n=1 Tax=Archocentrus centrarchus TaxID=63155 RepID=UPI0011EA061D|nr:C-type lectin domain family 10 member A-like [Archocentrus centrarchus]
MEESYYENDWDKTTIWTRATPPPPSESRSRRWLLPGLMVVVVLILIIVLGVTNRKMSNRLRTVERSVSNLSEIIQALNASLHHAHETAKEVKQLQFAVENNKDQLISVSEALKQLSVIDSLRKNVDAIKCSLDCIINNSSATGACCPLGWTVFESSCYYFSRESLSWNQSRDWCEKQEAHLVILLTNKEWDFVTSRTVPQYYWVGLSDWRTGSWEWVNRTPYTMEPRRWKPGQPDSWTGHGLQGDEDCANLHDDGRLNDQHCSTKMLFICQKHSLNA